MLQFRNVLDITEQSTWTKLPNVIYLINNVSSLKWFFKKEFPELSNLDLTIDSEANKEKFDEIWNHKNPYFKSLQQKIGIRCFYQIKSLFQEDFIDKKGAFLFQLIFIFKMKNIKNEDIYVFDTTSIFQPKTKNVKNPIIVEEALINFRDNVIEKLGEQYENEYLIQAKDSNES